MPMGYTSDIYDGKDVTLRDYLMRVGRSMGFAIMQRDDGLDEPVHLAEAYTSYYDTQEAKARARIADLGKMKLPQIAAAARAEHREALDAWTKSRDETIALRNRYEGMLIEVMAWQPDPLIASTKEQAEHYLRESIKFDCHDHEDWRPVEREPEVWYREELAKAVRDLEYAQTERAKEIERAAERNRYIEAFLASLPTI